MKKTLILMAAAASVVLTGCTESDISNDTSLAKESSSAIEFSAATRGAGTTRAGYEGNMTTDLLKNTATTDGFGVFAYYTGKKTYGQQQGTTYTGESSPGGNIAPNFMYNQQVTWNSTLEKWTYLPVKYWPNEVSTTSDDDQNDDSSNYPAYTDGENGGNVSFFAYAPYIPVSQSTATAINGATPESGAKGSDTDGITNISGNRYAGNPILTYVIPNDVNSATSASYVDLLWGTLLGTSKNVLNTGNAGVTGTGIQGTTATTYAAEVLKDEIVNADLTKQKTEGTIGFAFKHALASIGGGNTKDAGKAPNGFLVKLEIDKEGAEIGGIREGFRVSGSGANDAWRTIVTIKDVEITNDLNGNGSIDGSAVTLAGKNYTERGLPNTGTFDLATGQWLTTSNLVVMGQKIGTNIGAGTTYQAVLNTKIAEVYDDSGSASTWFAEKTGTATSDYFVYTLTENESMEHPGVTENVQSVYNNTAQNPFVLIPGSTPTFRVTVDYIVRTYDKNLSAECSTVEQKISKIITFSEAVQLNKHYNIVMHLGLTSVKFTASVSDWTEDNTGIDSDADGELDLVVEDVYLPRNVSGLTLTLSTGAKPVTGVASTTASGAAVTISNATYYIDDVQQTVPVANLTWDLAPTTPAWLSASGENLTVSAANTTFTDREVTATAKYSTFSSDAIKVKQYGRYATAVQLTSGTNLSGSVASAASNMTAEITTMNASGYETDDTGAKTSTAVPAQSITGEQYSLVYIDDSTGRPATWITVNDATKQISISENTTGVSRSATLYIKLNGRLIPTKNGESTYVINQSAS